MTNIEKVESLSRQELESLVTAHGSKNGILAAIGVTSRDPRARTLLIEKLNYYNIDVSGLRRHKQYTDEDLRVLSRTSTSISDMLTKLNLAKHGGNFKSVRMQLERLSIDITHFSSNDTRIASNEKIKRTAENVFIENSTAGRGNLRSYVLKFNILPNYVCSHCGNAGFWHNADLKLVVDHINGVNNDNRPENLRWLCPNCHSQTETFGTQSGSSNK